MLQAIGDGQSTATWDVVGGDRARTTGAMTGQFPIVVNRHNKGVTDFIVLFSKLNVV